jgi:hypothetical protein
MIVGVIVARLDLLYVKKIAVVGLRLPEMQPFEEIP